MERVRRPINAIGILIYARDTNRVLYLLRNSREQNWGIPGGKIERGETLRDAILRECREEIGVEPGDRLYPLDCYRSNDGKFVYHTFFSVVESEFVPRLNDEHIAYAWCDCGVYPRPLHTGLFATVTDRTIQQKISIILETVK
jgi:8-oxo-dGTP pyrophosphatase MutT (NUDIX family)